MAKCCGEHGVFYTVANKRLSLDLKLPESILARRGGISFGSSPFTSSRQGIPRLGRRGAISFDKEDKSARYIRQLGDVRIKSQENSLYQKILNNLTPSEKRVLQGLDYQTSGSRSRSAGNKFSTVSGMRRRRRFANAAVKPSSDGQSLLDDFYRSSTKCLLSKSSDWSFDIFSLDQSSNGRPLFNMVMKLFQEHNLIDHFDLDIIKLMKFASLVEEGYHQNPYHNAIHAADVTQAMHCYIMQEKIARHLSPLETMISLVSAITHDLDHPGVNQAFLIATSNHLASLYNNNSVLENHHWRSAVGILHESHLFDHLPLSVRKDIIIQMKSLILATDMTRQQEFYSKLVAHNSNGDLDMVDEDDRHFILQIALKCADISNPCRVWSTCKAWSHRVCDEFFQQGDFERHLSMPITNHCDRNKFNVPDIQTGFIDFVVEPLFKEFEKFLPCDMLTEQLDNMRTNRLNWGTIAKQLASQTRPLSLDVTDINSNVETLTFSGNTSADSGTESDGISSPLSSTSGASHSDLDDLPSDISDIRSHVTQVAERMDWSDPASAGRHQSVPFGESNHKREPFGRRESFPLIHDNRRTSLPHTSLYQAISFDRLVEKLTNIEKSSTGPAISTSISPLRTQADADHTVVNLDNLLVESRLSTLSPNIETSKITNYLVTKHLILK